MVATQANEYWNTHLQKWVIRAVIEGDVVEFVGTKLADARSLYNRAINWEPAK